MIFDLFSIQAEHGDALLIRYGDNADPHYFMVDGGPSGTGDTIVAILDSWRGERERLELEALVVTHYDLDHIEGVIELLRNKPSWLTIHDVWFNGLHHLLPPDLMGAVEGNELSELIGDNFPWNGAFDNRAIRISGPDPIELDGGLQVWVLSPGSTQLSNLATQWRSGMLPARDGEKPFAGDSLGRKDTWPPGKFASLVTTRQTRDGSVANGSSIALMIEFHGKKVLLAGDAFADVVETGLKTCWKSPPKVELCKLSHHGSQANTSASLLTAMDCKRYLVSTSGKIHAHPDNVLIARLLARAHRPEIIFNYLQPRTAGWQAAPDGWPSYTATYPRDGEPFVRVDLLEGRDGR